MSDMSQSELIEQLTADFSSRKPIRTGSLITTVFGDVVAPRGGTLWLGSLLPLLEAFGVNDSQARTAISRLTDDDWFVADRIGRKSYYGLTGAGYTRIDDATRRIYSAAPEAWSGAFCLIIVPGGSSDWRDLLRKELGWLGFGTVSPGVFIHPNPDNDGLEHVLSRVSPPRSRPVVIFGTTDPMAMASSLEQLVNDCWALDELAVAYGDFMAKFRALGRTLSEDVELSPWESLLARVMVIHEYRRLILRDPLLPMELLPADWPGTKARCLARDVYQHIVGRSEEWISANFQREDGALPRPKENFWQRFGGLPR